MNLEYKFYDKAKRSPVILTHPLTWEYLKTRSKKDKMKYTAVFYKQTQG